MAAEADLKASLSTAIRMHSCENAHTSTCGVPIGPQMCQDTDQKSNLDVFTSPEGHIHNSAAFLSGTNATLHNSKARSVPVLCIDYLYEPHGLMHIRAAYEWQKPLPDTQTLQTANTQQLHETAEKPNVTLSGS
jgi:hypothetical protein